MIINRRLKKQNAVAELTDRYGMKKIIVSAYDPQLNEMIDHGFKPIVNDLSKLLDRRFINWVWNLSAVL